MKGRNIKIAGHALKKSDPINRNKWECYCGAWGMVYGLSPKGRENGRRQAHDAHKIAVLQSQGKLEED
jgi:hypothetical protein